MAVDGVLNFRTKINTDGVDKGTTEISSKILSLKNKIANTEAEANRLKQELADMANTPVDTSIGDSIQKDLTKAEEKLRNFYAEADNIISQKQASLPEGLTDEQADKTLGIMLGQDKEWKKKEEQISQLETQVSKYKRELESARNVENQTTGKDTAEYRIKEQKLQDLTGKLGVYKAQLNETEQKESANAQKTSKASSAVSTFAKGTKTAANDCKALVNGLRNVASRLGTVAKAGLTAAKNGIGKVTNGIKNFVSHSKKANSQMGVLGKTLKRIERMIVSMIFYKVIRQGIQAIGEALGTLAKSSPLVNKQLSALMSSLTYLKNSLAAAFAPILTIVTPILTNFMDTLSKVTNKVGNFIAVLSGQSSYQKAVKVQQDYAKSLDKTTKSTKKLNKENEKSLASFDELNVMQDNSSSDDNSDSNSYFQTIPTAFDDFANKIKEAIKKGDFESIGQLIADKLNKGMKSIKWKKIRSTAKKWAKNIASFLNGFVGKLNWNLVGNTIGNGIMVAVDFAYTFLKKFKWKKFGKGIAKLLNGIIKAISWKKIGKTFGSYINAIINTAYGFVTTFNWKNFGSAIHTAIKNAFEKIDWNKARETLVTGINGLVSMAISIVGNPDFSALGANTAQGLIEMLNDINWGNISSLFTTLVLGALDFIDGFVVSIEWKELGDKIATSFKKFFKNGGDGYKFISKMVKTLVDLICGLITTFDEIAVSIDWSEFGQSVAESFNKFFGKNGDGRKLLVSIGKTIGDLCNSALQYLIGFFSDQSTADTLIKAVEAFLKSIPWKQLLINALSVILNATSWLVKAAIKIVEDFCSGMATGFTNAEKDKDVNSALKGFGKSLVNCLLTIAEGGLRLIANAIPNFVLAPLKMLYQAICGIVGQFLGDEWYQQQTKDLWGANSFKFDFPINLPRLASGTVVPTNYGEYLAVLGDNKREPEVVSPLSTMKQAFKEVVAEIGAIGSDTPITILLDGEVIYKNVVKHNNQDRKRRGKSLLA